MSKPSRWVDVSKFPEDEQPHMLELAQQHNALSEDFDRMTGNTPEEKENTYQAVGIIRQVFSRLHSKRFNIGFASFQIWVVLAILKYCGISTDQFSRLVEAVIGILEKFSRM